MHTIDYWYRYALYHISYSLFKTCTYCSFTLTIYFLFYRYEWKPHGSAHIHGLLWLDGALNIETLDWKDEDQVNKEISFFDKYVTTWNPRENHGTNIHMYQSIEDDPCFLDTKAILSSNPLQDYEQLLNRFQRHTKCSENSCLRKKGNKLECRYKCPWKVQNESSLHLDQKGQKTYHPTQNDDRLKFHNTNIL